jgi:hypothetical protein
MEAAGIEPAQRFRHYHGGTVRILTPVSQSLNLAWSIQLLD